MAGPQIEIAKVETAWRDDRIPTAVFILGRAATVTAQLDDEDKLQRARSAFGGNG